MTGGLAGGVRPFFMIWTSFFNLLQSPPIQCGKKTKTVTEAEGPLNYESHRLREWLWQPERPMRSTFSNSCNGDLFLEIVFWMKHKKNNHLRTKGRPAWSGRWGPLCCQDALPRCPVLNSQYLSAPSPPRCFKHAVWDLYNRQCNMPSVGREAQVCQDIHTAIYTVLASYEKMVESYIICFKVQTLHLLVSMSKIQCLCVIYVLTWLGSLLHR